MQNMGMVGILIRFFLKGKVNMYQFPKHEIKTANIFHICKQTLKKNLAESVFFSIYITKYFNKVENPV